MIKIFHLDLETTDKNKKTAGVHEVAGSIEINGAIVEEFDYRVMPFPNKTIRTESLAVSGTTVADLTTYPDGIQVVRSICNMIERHIDITNPKDKMFLSGYNAADFDSELFEQFLIDHGCTKYKAYFWNVVLDTMVMAGNVLRHERASMNDFSLLTVVKRFNIDVDPAQLHKAAYDSKLSRLLLNNINH